MIRGAMDAVPLWGVLVITIAAVVISYEVGYRLGIRQRNSARAVENAPISSINAAHLGLLAFILAFSFSMSASHFDTRKQVVLEEVNAISTAYLRTELITNRVIGEEIGGLLRDYIAIRVRLAQGHDAYRVIEETEALQTQIWQQLQRLTRGGDAGLIDSLLVQAINEVFDSHERRVTAGLHYRIPATIWTALYAILVFSSLAMSYSLGLQGTRYFMGSLALGLSFAVTMYLIADLDRPLAGLVVSDQSAIQALQKQLDQ